MINAVLWWVTEIEKHFGTVTDKLAIAIVFRDNTDFKAHAISKHHIDIFRRIVRTGVIITPKFRPPNGHKILNFLIALKAKQEDVAASKLSNETNELFGIMERTWMKFLNEFEGDRGKSKQKMNALWGSNPMSDHTKDFFNKSYQSALTKWNTIQIQK